MTRALVGSDLGMQPAVVALDARDQLPAGHMVFGLIENMRRVDMAAFEVRYRADGAGRPPYDPRMMLTLLVYCRAKGITSTRGVVQACFDDLGARLIMANRHPDRSTLDRFLGMHAEAIKAVLAQTLRLGFPLGLVDLNVVAGDGTVIDANAAMHATVAEPVLCERIETLRAQVDQAAAAWLAETGAQAEAAVLYGDAPGPGPRRRGRNDRAWQRFNSLQGRLRRHERAWRHLTSNPSTATHDWQERLDRDRQRAARCEQRLADEYAAAAAKVRARDEANRAGLRLGIGGAKPQTPDDYQRVRAARQALATAVARAERTAANPPTDRVNITDPASRIMPSKHGEGFAQRHNLQALSCRGQFILAVHTHDSPTDTQAMVTLLTTARANLDAAGITDPIGTALFDCGYASSANFTAKIPVEQLLIAVQREARQTARRQDGTSTAPDSWHAMAELLADPANAATYKQRGPIIEPVFAQLFTRSGRDINQRDTDVDTELHLRAIAHNLLKIIDKQHRRPPAS